LLRRARRDVERVRFPRLGFRPATVLRFTALDRLFVLDGRRSMRY
jgi:hypothetical protein